MPTPEEIKQSLYNEMSDLARLHLEKYPGAFGSRGVTDSRALLDIAQFKLRHFERVACTGKFYCDAAGISISAAFRHYTSVTGSKPLSHGPMKDAMKAMCQILTSGQAAEFVKFSERHKIAFHNLQDLATSVSEYTLTTEQWNAVAKVAESERTEFNRALRSCGLVFKSRHSTRKRKIQIAEEEEGNGSDGESTDGEAESKQQQQPKKGPNHAAIKQTEVATSPPLPKHEEKQDKPTMQDHANSYLGSTTSLVQFLHAVCALAKDAREIRKFIRPEVLRAGDDVSDVAEAAVFLGEIHAADPDFAAAVAKTENRSLIALAAFFVQSGASTEARGQLCAAGSSSGSLDRSQYESLIAGVLRAGDTHHRSFHSLRGWRRHDIRSALITKSANRILSRFSGDEPQHVDRVLTPENVTQTIAKATAFAKSLVADADNEVASCRAALDRALAKRASI